MRWELLLPLGKRTLRNFLWLEVDELKALAEEGMNSVPGIDAENVFAKLKARYARADNE